MQRLFCKYGIATPKTKEDIGSLLNADNIVGDISNVSISLLDGKHVASVVNRFNKSPAYFGEETSKELAVCEADSKIILAILTRVGFTERREGSNYWAEYALFCYNPSNEEFFKPFIDFYCIQASKGTRLDLNISSQDVEKIISSNGKIYPKNTLSSTKKTKGTVVLKSKKNLQDFLIEKGRERNIGCMIGGWAFLLLVVSLFIFIIYKILGN